VVIELKIKLPMRILKVAIVLPKLQTVITLHLLITQISFA